MYRPAAQLEHTDALAAEYDPTAQTPVTAVRPAVPQYDPVQTTKNGAKEIVNHEVLIERVVDELCKQIKVKGRTSMDNEIKRARAQA